MRLFVRSAMVLGLVVALTVVGIFVLRTQHPSEKTVATFLETVQLEAQTPSERAKTIRRVARMLNQIRPGERDRLEREGLTGEILPQPEPCRAGAIFCRDPCCYLFQITPCGSGDSTVVNPRGKKPIVIPRP